MPRRTFREIVEGLKAESRELRGSVKLSAALDAFDVDPSGRVCVDVGASTGGFTTVLLRRGATRVYAVDAGHGQLLGSLRQDSRVVNLEATNVGELTRDLVPEVIELVTIDVSYLSLSDAVAQLARLRFVPGADLVGLVKPMFELRLSAAPTDVRSLDRAIADAVDGVTGAGWDVVGSIRSPVTGAKGAVEGFVHARRRTAAR
jgi:23S rRNA (cytidine1920-2'-O)/16S rRNA (cytidine1409-2'-O)-methyltransferase